ncbi:NB-ARC domain-containing protein [Streptomyces collinus]|uniref:WD40 repeat protein n=1 Tax=Streptomyces collinus TaxID=42684 RepID=A0AA89QGG2_STRCU|nr:NB-ARC domain-containing protein [Streptomyces collinus]MBB5812264.1 WD40 repeat protein [Streptomyces collinus]WMX65429.1 NB-ARC domain-containing protein [Streptomyces collinus]
MSNRGRWALAIVIALGVAAIAWLLMVALSDGWGQADPIASVFGGVVGVTAFVVSLVMPRTGPKEATVLPPKAPAPESWFVHRDELEQAVAAVCRRGNGSAVAFTTALKGAGGFGKTTLAKQVCAHPDVQKAFGEHIYFVTVGRDVRGRAAIAAKVAAVTLAVTGEPLNAGPDADPAQMGEHFGQLLTRRPRTLLVIDDIWEFEQLSPFLRGAEDRCVRLVTTRNPDALPSHVALITVDRMSAQQSRTVLCHGLDDSIPGPVLDALLKATGRWALLLRMVNQYVATLTATGIGCGEAAQQIYTRLRTFGPAGADHEEMLDLNDPERRNRAVRASIQAAITLLPSASERFAELGIFAEDEKIPMSLIVALWEATGGLDEAQTRHLLKQMSDLSLISIDTTVDGGGVELHDVIREYQRAELGDRLATLNATFLEAIAASIPNREWWQTRGCYLQNHLIAHFLAAGRQSEAEELAGDLRWISYRLQRQGPTAPISDLASIDTPTARVLAADLTRAGHLLSQTEPPHSRDAVLRSRLHSLPHWNSQVDNLYLSPPVLIDKWPPPDLPYRALRRTLAGHTQPVTSVTISSDGTWIASASADGTTRTWDATTGEEQLIITGHEESVTSVAISPDGTWLATTSGDQTARIWDATDGTLRNTLTGHSASVTSVAISPDGTWLATTSGDRTVRIWDATDGTLRNTLTGHTYHVNSVAISPDGTWLATAGGDTTVRIWDVDTGQERFALQGHSVSVLEVTISPDGTWLATAGGDGRILIRDAVNGEVRDTLDHGGGAAWSVIISPDKTRLFSCSDNGAIRIYDASSGVELHRLRGHTDTCLQAAIGPCGTWLATASHDSTVRIWDLTALEENEAVSGHTDRLWSLAASPDGSWLATASLDETVRIWNSETGQVLHVLGPMDAVWYLAVSPDATWLASVGSDCIVHIWDSCTGQELQTLVGHTNTVWSVAISPDGTWLATCSEDGTVRIWDCVDGTELHTLSGITGSLGQVIIDPHGRRVIAREDEKVLIWDASTGERIHELTGHNRLVQQVSVSPDGTWLATASSDQTARIWDSHSGQERKILNGHTKAIYSVSISPDGSWLATASYDETARIWDATTGVELHTLTGHSGAVTAVAISPCGTWLATTSDDKTVRVWDPTTGVALAMTRLDSSPHIIAWSPTQPVLFIAGEMGPYGYEFRCADGGSEEDQP